MILFALPVLVVLGAIVFALFWPFIRKPVPGPNRYGGHRSARGIGGAIAQGFNRCFDFKGRSSRLDFWAFAVFAGAVWLATCVSFILLAVQEKAWIGAMLLLVMWPIVAIPSLSIAVRRLHDNNRSGLWVPIFFVFGYFVLLYWFLQPSQQDVVEVF